MQESPGLEELIALLGRALDLADNLKLALVGAYISTALDQLDPDASSEQTSKSA